MITIELDLSAILIAAISSLVSIAGSAIVTWYFSKRHYMRRPQPVTENEVVLEQSNKEFKLVAIFLIGIFLIFGLMIIGIICGT